ncbi:phosphopentomutase isoform X2 [Lepeophtheirus salmonis]|nr:phosphoglucomutase-2-like isoform X2 [Lepeophtheirus salmonis]
MERTEDDYSRLHEMIQKWLEWTLPGTSDHDSISNMVKENCMHELDAIMSKRLVFGTAGIRANMGPGFSQLNDLVVVQTAQGMANYLIDYHQANLEKAKSSGIVIGFDGRHNSNKWAKIIAIIFVSLGFKVHLYSKMTPTPWVPFAVKKHGHMCGIMVTASHNPKNDNGIKVYWSNGVQILSPHDVNIQKSILKHAEPRPCMKDILDKLNNPKFDLMQGLFDPFDQITQEYFYILEHNKLLDKEGLNKCFKGKIVYTPMHGVGSFFIDKSMEIAGFQPVIHVPLQKDPDPNFPTVKFPNPEEGKSALNLAIIEAEKMDAIYIIANDPDADRLAVAQKMETGKWKVFTGNELGSLFGWFLHVVHAHKYPNYKKDSLYYIASTVSSKMLKTMARMEGMHFEETLTGFKWMCNKAKEVEDDSSKTVLMAFEESIGYMCGTSVLDKDGITAAVRMTELIAYLHLRESGKTLLDKLKDIYDKYGYHFNINSYFFNHDSELTARIFERIRTLHNGGYPISISNGKYSIKHIRDLTTGYDSSMPNQQSTLPTSSLSQMLTFTFENGFVITLRTSGTEPKLKYYAELCGAPDEKDHKKIEALCKEMINATLEEFLEPKKNKLKPQE